MTYYPYHDEDGGALLPTSSAGLVCARCHRVIARPDFGVLRQALEAHRASGLEPVVIGERPPPEALTIADLTASERKSLSSAHAGNLRALSEKSVAPLVLLGLVKERVTTQFSVVRKLTVHGARLAGLCAEVETRSKATTEALLDIGEPDPAAVRRLEFRASARRKGGR